MRTLSLSPTIIQRLSELAHAFDRLRDAAIEANRTMAKSTEAFHLNCRCQSSPELRAKPHMPMTSQPHDPRLRNGRGLHHGYGPKGRNRR